MVRDDGFPTFVYSFALDTVAEFLYGYSVHSQTPEARQALPTLDGLEGAETSLEIGDTVDVDGGSYHREAVLGSEGCGFCCL